MFIIIFFFHLSYYAEQRKLKVNMKWKSPPTNIFKLNIDKSYFSSTRLSACGYLIRNSKGIYVSSFFCNLDRSTFLSANLLGTVHGLGM